MSPHPDLPGQTRAAGGATSRDAGLQRIRSVTKAAAATSAFGSVALGLVFALPSLSQVSPSTSGTSAGQGTAASNNPQAQAVPPPQPPAADGSQAQQLAAPPQPPAAVAPPVQPQAVSGGS